MSRTADSVAPPSSSTPTPQRPPRLALLIATGFGLGYVRRAPGTVASLITVILTIVVASLAGVSLNAGGTTDDAVNYHRIWLVAILLVTGGTGVWAANQTAQYVGRTDPQIIVIDEVSGQIIPLFAAGWGVVIATCICESGFFCEARVVPQWKYLTAGFILFRVFDIWKPWPVRAAERLPGGWGIMADDWVAGIYAALCLWALRAAGM